MDLIVGTCASPEVIAECKSQQDIVELPDPLPWYAPKKGGGVNATFSFIPHKQHLVKVYVSLTWSKTRQ
jgi:hypothetical protein